MFSPSLASCGPLAQRCCCHPASFLPWAGNELHSPCSLHEDGSGVIKRALCLSSYSAI